MRSQALLFCFLLGCMTLSIPACDRTPKQWPQDPVEPRQVTGPTSDAVIQWMHEHKGGTSLEESSER